VFRARKSSAPGAKAGGTSSSASGPSVVELLANRCLTVAYMDGEYVAALCRMPDRYDLGYDAERGWWCSCEELADCDHLAALKLVTEAAVGARERTAVVLGREEGAARSGADGPPA
jgi:hypothetical protein